MQRTDGHVNAVKEEGFVVVGADTVVDPWTVVIHTQSTSIADRTMMRANWLPLIFTFLAFSIIFQPLGATMVGRLRHTGWRIVGIGTMVEGCHNQNPDCADKDIVESILEHTAFFEWWNNQE
jgi:hypothetical protein